MVRTPPDAPDRELVTAAKAGDRTAFVVLYERYFHPIYDFTTRMTRDRDEAADITQETFIRALERLGSLEDGGKFKSWLFTIARNETLDRFRRAKRVRPLTSMGDDGEPVPMDVVDPDRLADPATAAEANAMSRLVWEAAAGLDPRQLSILDLHLRQGLSSAEIADVVRVTRNNGYVMLNRLKSAVQATIEAFLLFREGRDGCEDLAAIVDRHETEAMSPDLRRSISQHAARCAPCSERKRTLVAPLAVLGAFVPVPLAPGLSAGILERVLDHVPEVAPSSDDQARALLGDDEDAEVGTTLVDLTAPSDGLERPDAGNGVDIEDSFDLELEPEV